MKKILTLLSFIAIFTGCTKQYNSIDKYYESMLSVRNKIPAYTLEVSQSIPDYNMQYKSYIKNDKWVTEVSKDDGATNFVTLVSSGNDLCYYSNNSEYAIILPVEKLLIDKSRNQQSDTIWMLNPIGSLFYWVDGRGVFDSLHLIANDVDTNRQNYDVGTTNAKISKNFTQKNGFKCRMVQFGNNEYGREACISEEYGIAVYSKLMTKNSNNKPIEIITNVNKINISDISDNLVKLPNNKTKITRKEFEQNKTNSENSNSIIENPTKENSTNNTLVSENKENFNTTSKNIENSQQIKMSNDTISEQYYCPSQDGSYNASTYVYNPKEDCSVWNSDFWKKNNPSAFSECINNKKVTKRKYEQGLCVPIIQKVHKFGNVDCTVEVAEKYNMVISKGCTCSNSRACPDGISPYIEKLNKMYKD